MVRHLFYTIGDLTYQSPLVYPVAASRSSRVTMQPVASSYYEIYGLATGSMAKIKEIWKVSKKGPLSCTEM